MSPGHGQRPEWDSGGSMEDLLGALKRKARDPRIQLSLEKFHTDPTTPITTIASSVNLSVSRFRHLFAQEVGISPGHYLGLLRLELARLLLQTSFLRVKEVAARVGVDDVSHFVRNYAKCYKETPSQTRTRQTPDKP